MLKKSLKKTTCLIVSISCTALTIVGQATAEDRVKCVQPAGKQVLTIGKPTADKKIKVTGSGWCSSYKLGGSGAATVALKFNYGGVSHINTKVHSNKTVWYIVHNADPKTGNFEVDLPLPNNDGDEFTRYTGEFDPDDFYVTALAGSLSKNAIPGSETRHFQNNWKPTARGNPNFTHLREGFGKISLSIDEKKHRLNVYMPTAKPGDMVWADYDVLIDADAVKGKCTGKLFLAPQADVWNYWWGRPDDKVVNVKSYRKVRDDRTISLPLYGVTKDMVGKGPYDAMAGNLPIGPALINIMKISPSPDGGEDILTEIGSAWVTNLAIPKMKYSSLGVTMKPKLKVGLHVEDLPDGWEKYLDNEHSDWTTDYGPCKFRNPFVNGTKVAVPAAPTLLPGRKIHIPNQPLVKYTIDDKTVVGDYEIKNDSAHIVTIVAHPEPGFILDGADYFGEVTYKVQVPKKEDPILVPKVVRVVVNEKPITITPAPKTVVQKVSGPNGVEDSSHPGTYIGSGILRPAMVLVAAIAALFGYIGGFLTPRFNN